MKGPKFRLFLIASWPHLDSLMESHNWDEDGGFTLNWLQANWEILVERELLGDETFLMPLSVPLTTRVINKNARAKYSVMTYISRDMPDCRTEKKLPQNCTLRFFGLLSALKAGGFGLYPPFDFVHLVLDSTKETFIVPFSGLQFHLIELI